MICVLKISRKFGNLIFNSDIVMNLKMNRYFFFVTMKIKRNICAYVQKSERNRSGSSLNVNKKALSELLSKEIDIRTAFLKEKRIDHRKERFGWKRKSFVLIMNQIDELDLPKEGTYLK